MSLDSSFVNLCLQNWSLCGPLIDIPRSISWVWETRWHHQQDSHIYPFRDQFIVSSGKEMWLFRKVGWCMLENDFGFRHILFSMKTYTQVIAQQQAHRNDVQWGNTNCFLFQPRPGAGKGVRSGLALFALYFHTAHHMLELVLVMCWRSPRYLSQGHLPTSSIYESTKPWEN